MGNSGAWGKAGNSAPCTEKCSYWA